MLAVALLLALVWVFTWSWNADERIVLGTWLVFVLPTIALGRRGRFRGFIAATLAGAIFPVTVFWCVHALPLGFGINTRVADLMTPTLISIAVGGGIAALTSIALIQLITHLSAQRRKQLVRILLGLMAVGFAARIILVVYQDRVSWKPVFTLGALDSKAAISYWGPFALSDDGSLLAVAEPFANEDERARSRLQLWNLEHGQQRPRWDLSIPMVQSVCFSPDTSKLAVVHTGDRGISIYDTFSGELVKSLPVSSFSPWQSNSCCFSGNGRKLVFCNYDTPIQAHTVQVWRTDTWKPVSKHRTDPSWVRLFPTEQGAICLLEGANPKLVDAESQKPVTAKAIDYDPKGQPFVSRDGKFVGSGKSLVEVETGIVHPLTATINGLLSHGRFVTCRCDMDGNQSPAAPDFLEGVPFFRHLWMQGRYRNGQVVLLDTFTGEEVRSSPDYTTDEAFYSFQSSADGKTVAGQTWRGSMYVWRVPE
jgi:hypothetical protein